MKLTPERQQKVDTLINELNTLATRYEQKGFKFEAFQTYEFSHHITVTIQNDTYKLQAEIRPNMDNISEQTTKLIDCFFNLTLKLYTFSDFLTDFHNSGFETRNPYTLILDPTYENVQIKFTVPTDTYSPVAVTFSFDNHLAFISRVQLFSLIGQDYIDYRITLPETTAKLTIDGGSNAYNQMYINDEKEFPYGSTTNQVITIITKFVHMINKLDLEIL
jgi:hypothetical protein